VLDGSLKLLRREFSPS